LKKNEENKLEDEAYFDESVIAAILNEFL